MSDERVPISSRYTLSIPEAANYFGIGIRRLTRILDENPDADFVLEIGTHRKIKRKLFEKYIDEATTL